MVVGCCFFTVCGQLRKHLKCIQELFLYHSMLWKKCKEKGLNEQNVEIWKGIAMQDIRDILFKDLEGRQYWRDVACRMCMVEVDGTDRLVTSCNTGALTARDNTNRVLDALADPDITTIVQVAPAVRVAWAETFRLPTAWATTGHMVSALRQIGFDYIFDTNFTADLTIMEEGSEFIERFTHKEQHSWPMFTSCCPG